MNGRPRVSEYNFTDDYKIVATAGFWSRLRLVKKKKRKLFVARPRRFYFVRIVEGKIKSVRKIKRIKIIVIRRTKNVDASTTSYVYVRIITATIASSDIAATSFDRWKNIAFDTEITLKCFDRYVKTTLRENDRKKS